MKRTAYTLAAAVALALGTPALAEPAVGSAAPDFTLTDEKGTQHSLAKYKGSVVVLEWTNSGCPFVKRHYTGKPTMKTTAEKFAGKKVVWLAINSTSSNTAADSKKWNADQGRLPTLATAKARGKLYGPARRPHVRHRGQGSAPLRGAMTRPAARTPRQRTRRRGGDRGVPGKDPRSRRQAYGCSVKYKSGK